MTFDSYSRGGQRWSYCSALTISGTGTFPSPSFAPEIIVTLDSYSKEWGEAVCFLILVRHHCRVPSAVEFPDLLLVQCHNDEKELFTLTTLRRRASSGA